MDQAAWLTLAVAGAVAAMLLLWLNRGGTFYVDELVWFSDLAGENGLSSILEPHNSHLHGTIRTIFLLTMEIVGTHYVVFRILAVISLLLCVGLFFALAKRRIGAIPALVPSILLLFYGSAWQHVVVPIGFTIVFSAAAGLAALLALERDDRRGDVIACAAVSLSVFTFTVGLGFLVGVAISVILRKDRLRRAWIFVLPLLLYSAWWLWALQFEQGRTEAANIGNVIPFFASSLNVVTGALTGVNVPFSRFGDATISVAATSVLGWFVAIAFVGALAWRIRRGDVPVSLYVSLGVLCTYWLAAALADTRLLGTQVEAVRYVFPGSIGVLLVATDIARGLSIRRAGMIALLGVGTFSLAMNLVFLRDGAVGYRTDYSPATLTALTMLELGAGYQPGSGPSDRRSEPRAVNTPDFGLLAFSSHGSDYLESAGRYGSPAFTLDELRAAGPAIRSAADGSLVAIYGLTVVPSPGPTQRSGCDLTQASLPAELPPGGANLRLRGPQSAQLSLSRFGIAPGAAVGTLPGDQWLALRIPPDEAPEPWYATASGEVPLLVCPID